MRYVAEPNIPEAEITSAALCRKSKAFDAISSMGIAVVPVLETDKLSGATASHADLQLLHLGGNKIIDASCCDETKDMLKSLEFEVKIAQKELSDGYPNDCVLNALIIGSRIICSGKVMDPLIGSFAKETGREVLNVKQGYARCSCAVINKNAVITADAGICDAAKAAGMDVLLIHAGYIELEGYDTGFIGGCCGLIAPDVLATTGNITEHIDGENMRAFARNYGVYIEPLSPGTLIDVGGIIPLTERGADKR